jgi:hypothetical protein
MDFIPTRLMVSITKGDRPMTVINVFTVAPEEQARLAEALIVARFDPGFYEVTEVFAPEASSRVV